jgi:uridine kinase
MPETSPPPAAAPSGLGACKLLRGLAPDDLERVAARLERIEVAEGSVLLREGDRSQDLYFLLAGTARLRRHQMSLRAIGPGDHFGALALFTGRPRTTSVTATSPLTLARLSPAAWKEVEAAHPRIAMHLLRSLLSEVRDDLVEMTDSVGALLRGRSLPRQREVEVRVGGTTRRVETGTPVRALLPEEEGGALVVAGLLGQKPVSLSTPVFAPCSVAPLAMTHWEGRQIYQLSVGLALLEAARKTAPGRVVRLGPSRGTSQLVEVEGGADAELAAALTREMRALVATDLPIRHEHWTLEEAAAMFRERGWLDAVQLLRIRRGATVPLAALGGTYALARGPMLPGTGLIKDFGLDLRGGELLLHLGRMEPRGDGNGGGGAATATLRDGGMVEEHLRWLSAMGVTSVGAFNERCVSGQVSELIRVAEGFHEKRIAQVADEIAARRDRLRIIAIAGPSSSGKTTFIRRLSLQLQINGLTPAGLSLDDYYLDRERTAVGPDGERDYEALEAIDLPALQDHLRRLLAGEEVASHRYDFRSGKSRPGEGPRVRLGEGRVLLVEGIHGLAPRLLGEAIGDGEIFRIFIHPATTLPFDRLARVSATDLRLLRRIVRDRHGRAIDAGDSILRWPSVQRGEQRHIFPYQAGADVVFDSALVYEPAVLKVFAERYLLEVHPSHPAFPTAVRLRHLVDDFVSIYPDHVPPTSILREFLGGSGFDD